MSTAPTAAAGKPNKEVKYKLRDDLAKVPRDFLKKSFLAAGEWKLETKRRIPADTVGVNPKYEGGRFSVDFVYNSTRNVTANTTVNLAANGDWKVTTKTPVGGGATVEVETTPKACDVTIEGTYKGVKVTDKLNSQSAELLLTYPITPVLTVGSFLSYGLKTAVLGYGVSARAQDKSGYHASLFAANDGAVSFAAATPPLTIGKWGDVSAFANAEAASFNKITKGELGTQFTFCGGCPYAPVLRAKLSLALEFVVALSAKVANNTTVAVTLQQARGTYCGFNYGVAVTQE